MRPGPMPVSGGIPTGQVEIADSNGKPWKWSKTYTRQHDGRWAPSSFSTRRRSVLPAELLDGQDRHKLLAAWLRGEG